jgi:SAM-dependent methyltransferase
MYSVMRPSRTHPLGGLYTKMTDIYQRNFPSAPDNESWLTRLVKFKIFGKTPMNTFLRLNRRLWNQFPTSATTLRPMRLYGYFLHRLVRTQSVRGQLCHTFFLRNRCALELIRRLVERSPKADALRVAVLGCSTGAEAYSVAWRIRSARPDLKLILQAVDISQQAVKVARDGVYSPVASQITGTNLFDGMTQAEIEELFDRDGDVVAVKSWIRQGVSWHVADVARAEIFDTLGPQDIVVANNFLCHMDAASAEACLRNIVRLVSPTGYLFVSGIDLDIRTRVAEDLGWNPLQELLEEIHNGDPRMRVHWPWNYSALEPLNKRRPDWRLRYAAAFQVIAAGERTTKLRMQPL